MLDGLGNAAMSRLLRSPIKKIEVNMLTDGQRH